MTTQKRDPIRREFRKAQGLVGAWEWLNPHEVIQVGDIDFGSMEGDAVLETGRHVVPGAPEVGARVGMESWLRWARKKEGGQ